MSVIYTPSGRALEYSPLALNLYETCPHACKYCYCPGCLHKKPEQFFGPARARKNILERLEKDCKKMAGDPREILLNFIGDPFPTKFASPADCVTEPALGILEKYKMRVQVLSKGLSTVAPCFDILKRNNWKLGTTLTLIDGWEQWEPYASSSVYRMLMLKQARKHGIYTWVSLEPVIDPQQSLETISEMRDYVDFWKFGKLNHFPEIEKKVNWSDFLEKALDALKGKNYLIKKDLLQYLKF